MRTPGDRSCQYQRGSGTKGGLTESLVRIQISLDDLPVDDSLELDDGDGSEGYRGDIGESSLPQTDGDLAHIVDVGQLLRSPVRPEELLVEASRAGGVEHAQIEVGVGGCETESNGSKGFDHEWVGVPAARETPLVVVVVEDDAELGDERPSRFESGRRCTFDLKRRPSVLRLCVEMEGTYRIQTLDLRLEVDLDVRRARDVLEERTTLVRTRHRLLLCQLLRHLLTYTSVALPGLPPAVPRPLHRCARRRCRCRSVAIPS